MKNNLEKQRELLSEMVDKFGIHDSKVLIQSQKLDRLVFDQQKLILKKELKHAI